MKRTLIGLIIGFVVGIVLLPACAFVYIRFGYAPVATAGPPLPLEKRLASMALKARIKREAPKESPVPPTEEDIMAGAKVYREYCAVCHGMSGQPKTPTAKGMYPPPPQLFHGKGVTDDPVGETYWKVANGIRLTGMPAYKGSLSDLQLWQVSQLLAKANDLPAPVSQFLGSEPPAK
ncbi:MAG TPA: cytochrome c [Verrucomicrobiae bacterium]|nr:cytochrome c [Verrucomicrobiae bacterium]